MDVAPGSKKKMSQVKANARALGKLSTLRFADCAFEDKASEELAEAAMRYAGSYESAHGFKWPSSRLRQVGRRVSAFFPDTPSSFPGPAWMLYKRF